jgi:glycosyltransferase involved in cell wall biosynthesis
MRVCLVSQEYPPDTSRGGIGTQTWNKAHQLVGLGHDVDVLSCMGNSDKRSRMHTERSGGIRVHRMRPPGEDPGDPVPLYDPAVYSVGYSWQVLEALERLSRDRDFDLINFPEYGAEGFAYQLNRTSENWIPVVVQLHGPLAMFSERIGWPAPDSRLGRVGDFMEGQSIRLADALMASSANIADFTADHYGVERDSIRVVHCGIDCEVFTPPEDGRRSERPTVLFVGNVEASKGVKTVFEAVLQLRERHAGIRLQVLGSGDVAAELQARAKREGAEDCLELVGHVGRRELLPQYYRSAHVMASPADHEVGVANVYVEAMSCACPVVAADAGGAPEAVDHEQSGLLVPPRDVEATRVALDRILGDAAFASRLGAAGRRRAETYFRVDHYIGRVLSAYGEAIERSSEKRARLARAAGWS